MRLEPEAVRETHISRVVLAGDRAYKRKKPVRLPFVDYGSLERRHAFCREEVRLNRRLAPDVYLGVKALVADGDGLALTAEETPGAVDYVVEMRRYDEAATLARRIAAGAAGEAEVRAVGRRLARFHREAACPPDPEHAVDALEATLAENFATLRGLGADVGDEERLARAVMAGRRAELLARARAGLVRDGHGDLRAEHVVLERGIEIVDCVEFDPALREIDVGFDVGFLAMDLMRTDERLSAALVAAYRQAGGDPGDDSLVTFFAAQRALIRAKVALVRAGQVDAVDAQRRRTEAAALLALAGRLTWRVRLGVGAIVCGLAASGKSLLAAALAERAGATVLSSDHVRKELLGLLPADRAPESAYEPRVNRRTYAELGRRARESVAAGRCVIVDATFRFGADRRAFGPSALTWIECRAPAGLRARRAAARVGGASDAGAAVARSQTWEPLDDPVVVRTDQAPAAVVEHVRDRLDERVRGELRTRSGV